jgi:hypothetical protein
MVLPLIPLAMYAPAAIAGIGAAAKGLSGGRGQRLLQGGINTLSKLGQSPWLTKLADRFKFGYAPDGGKIGNIFSQAATPGGMQSGNPMNIYGLETIKGGIDFPQEVVDDKDFWKEMFDKYLLSEDKKEKKKNKERTEKKALSKEKVGKKKKAEERTIPEYDAEGGLVTMHEGGDAKKKKKGYAKKRKHYRASSFVKMKKKKKYIT